MSNCVKIAMHYLGTKRDNLVLTEVDGEEEHGRDVDHLDGGHLDGVDGGDGEGRGVLVGVVKLVEALVEEGHVVDPVGPVGQVVLEGTNQIEHDENQISGFIAETFALTSSNGSSALVPLQLAFYKS